MPLATLISAVPLTFSSTTPVGVTVPTGADGVAIFTRAYADTQSFSSSFTGTFQEITVSSGDTSGRIFYANVSSTGSQTITLDYGTFLAEGLAATVAFIGDIDNSNFDWMAGGDVGLHSSVVAPSDADSLVLAAQGWYTGGVTTPYAPPATSGWTVEADVGPFNSVALTLYSRNTPGDPTTTFDEVVPPFDEGGQYSTIGIISIIGVSGGGTNYNASVSETATGSDVVASAFGAAGARSETATGSEIRAAALGAAGARSETATGSDTSTARTNVRAARSETAVASDTSTASTSVRAARSETATGSDTVSAETAGVFNASVSETATGSDSYATIASLNPTVSETAAGSDTVAGATGVISARSETATGNDTTAAGLAALSSLSETVAGTDTVAADLTPGVINATVSEMASATDSSSARFGAGATVLETVTALDALFTNAQFFAVLAETVAASEASAAGGRNWDVAVAEMAAAEAFFVGGSLWTPVSDSQSPGWQNVSDTQAPGWTGVNDAQTPGWQDI